MFLTGARHHMDDAEGDPFADLDAEMDAVGDTPPDVEMPLPVAVPPPAPEALPPPSNSLFNYGPAPSSPMVLLESKTGNKHHVDHQD